jgi:type IX secretion system PorP/SprF family membrane protein
MLYSKYILCFNKLKQFLLLCFLCFGLLLKAQDPQFSQFYAVPLYLAPSFAGTSMNKTRVAMNYRNQWPEIPNAYSTYSFSFDHYISKIRSGVGLLAVRDQAGPGKLALTNIGGIYSFDFRVNEDIHIRPGAHFLYTYRSIDYSSLVFYDQVKYGTPSTAFVFPSVENRGDLDFSVSVMSYASNYWLGVTADHLMKPNQSFFGDDAVVPIKYSVFGGTKVLLKERLLVKQQEDVSFAFLYKKQADFQQLDLGAYYFKNPMVFGIWYRGIPLLKNNYPGSDALIFLVGYRYENMSIGYSYDFTISKLRNLTAGSHEISLVYSFRIKKFKSKPASLPCPEF